MQTAPLKLFSRPSGVVFACTVGNAVSVTPMVYTVFSLFLIPIATEFGWPRSAVSIVLLIIAVTGVLSYPIVGRIIDRYGARLVILAGNLLFACSVFLISLAAASHWQFYLAYALVGITAAIPSSVVFTKVIAGWFDQNRGLFLGVAGGVGNGVGCALAAIYAQSLISNYGWRGAYQGIALAIIIVGFPILYLFLHDPPRATAEETTQSQGMTLPEARMTSTFWMILTAVTLGAGCMTAVFAHVIPMLMDRGISAASATTVLATFSMVTATWQVGMGYLLDRVPKPWIAAPFYLGALVGLLVFQSTSSFPLLILASVLMGLGLGTEYGLLPYFLSRYFGVKHYGAISGVVYGVIVLTQGITPFLMDVTADITGTYDIAITFICIGLLTGAVLVSRLKPFDLYRVRWSRGRS